VYLVERKNQIDRNQMNRIDLARRMRGDLPIYDEPMIYYPIWALVDAEIQEIMLVTGENSAGDFLKLLGNGKDFGLKWLNIVDALRLAEHFADGESVCNLRR
jgi:dTDP-glucose pyrophosphorylase